ncbi:MAG: ketopantoate reductase family protein [Pseudonocardia sp.]|nr:ketopantoate reductase family protein [Pseudonocardia sp.]
MRYVVIGAGAVGGTIGVRLAEAGRDVVLVARGAHLAAIRERGLRLDEPGRSRAVRLPTAAAVSEVDWRADDVALLCTKTQDTPPLLDALYAVAPDVPVVCVQNGVENERLVAERFAHVLGICVMMPTEHLEPGRVVAYSGPVPGRLDIGVYPDGTDPLTEAVAADLTAAGFASRAEAAIMRWKWWKMIVNLENVPEAVCGLDDPDLRTLVKAVRAEGRAVLDAAGIDYVSAEESRERQIAGMTVQAVDGHERTGGSTWQSLQRGVGSVEAEYLNGEFVALGEKHGVPTPLNRLLLETITAMAAGGERPGAHTAADLLAAT